MAARLNKKMIISVLVTLFRVIIVIHSVIIAILSDWYAMTQLFAM